MTNLLFDLWLPEKFGHVLSSRMISNNIQRIGESVRFVFPLEDPALTIRLQKSGGNGHTEIHQAKKTGKASKH